MFFWHGRCSGMEDENIHVSDSLMSESLQNLNRDLVTEKRGVFHLTQMRSCFPDIAFLPMLRVVNIICAFGLLVMSNNELTPQYL